MNKSLHLIPVGLSSTSISHWLPQKTQELASELKVYIAENAKTARAFLNLIGTQTPIQDITIYTLSKKTTTSEIHQWLKNSSETKIGLVSEAGCPAVADPGAAVVAQAHQLNYQVIPWVGPSSILLSLMASGLDGQRFAFHGYAPIKAHERAQELKQWENTSKKNNQTQLFIETPYRNKAMYETLLKTLNNSTRLCIARDLTGPQEWIKTKTIQEWKQSKQPELDKIATIFLFLA